jgi:hypothetical protein
MSSFRASGFRSLLKALVDSSSFQGSVMVRRV